MNERITAILNFDENRRDNVINSVQKFKNCGKVCVFQRESSASKPGFFSASDDPDVEIIRIPDDMDTEPRRRNWVNRKFKDEGFGGFLHVVADGVSVKRNPFMFVNDLETMMDVFDYDVWFNTICDGCNYVYSKYNPRIYVDVDIPDVQTKLGLSGRLNFTSHSNQQWISYNMSKAPEDLLRFDENFTIPMFWIIEFLARRRNTKPVGSLYFMNYYLSVDSERGVFENCASTGTDSPDPVRMKEEDSMFKGKNIRYESDQNVDMILEVFWKKIKEKLEKSV